MIFRVIAFILVSFHASAQSIEQTQVFARTVQSFLAAIEPTYSRAQALKTVRVMYTEAAAGARDKAQTRTAAQVILENAHDLPAEIELAMSGVDFSPVGHPPYDKLLQAMAINAGVFASVARADLNSTRLLLKAADDRDRSGFIEAYNSYDKAALDGENFAILISEAALALDNQAGPKYWITTARIIQMKVVRDTIRLSMLPPTSPERIDADMEEIWASGAQSMNGALDKAKAALQRFERKPIAKRFLEYRLNGVSLSKIKRDIESLFSKSISVERAIVNELELTSALMGRAKSAGNVKPFLKDIAEGDRRLLSLLGQRQKLTKELEPLFKVLAQAEL